MTTTITERTHSGTIAYFIHDELRYCVVTCCDKAQIEIVDEQRQQCRTICPVHYPILRTYERPMTDDERAMMDSILNGASGFNPAGDPHGERHQRQRSSGYTTSRWYQARGL